METNGNTYSDNVLAAQRAAAVYEAGEAPLMTDAAFDELLASISLYEETSGVVGDHGLFTTVGHDGAVTGDVTHEVRMLSLDKVGHDELAAFIDKHGEKSVVIEPKLDGLAVRLVYRAGELVQAVRRGDGYAGEDVTAQVLSALREVPTHVEAGDFEVRGELYLNTAGLQTANQIRVAASKAPFANARNGAAGIVARKDAAYPNTLSFAPYGVIGEAFTSNSHSESMFELVMHGFTPAITLLPTSVQGARAEGVLAAVEALRIARPTIGFLMDGVVIKVDSLARQSALGESSRAPRWAVAYKYPAVEGQSRILDIESAIGKTGRLSLRARFTPVHVDGSVLEYASLHNVGWLKDADIRIGDEVVVYKANDIIPQVRLAEWNIRGPESTVWEAPVECPQCGGEFDKSTELWRCINPECSVGARILYAVSRDCLDIEGIGSALVDALVESGAVKTIADLFTLTENALATTVVSDQDSPVRLFGKVKAVKVMSELEKAKSAAWNRVITSLSMRMCGRTMGRRLAGAFPTLELLLAATEGQLATVEGIGTVKATFLHEGIQDNRVVLETLASHGVNMGAEPEATSGEKVLGGLSVCVTGSVKSAPSLASLSRTGVQELIEANGGKAASSVSASTSLLVCGEPGSSKWQKATDLGIRIVTPVEFAEMLSL